MNEYNINPKEYEPRMHSAEHILNQTMVRMFNCGRAFSAHIEKKKSKCDYHYQRNLTSEEISQIEQKVNDVVHADLPIRESLLDRNEAEQQFNLVRLPKEVGKTIRIITIGDYDTCPCSGMHALTTKEIGEFKIISTDCTNGVLRIRFRIHPLAEH